MARQKLQDRYRLALALIHRPDSQQLACLQCTAAMPATKDLTMQRVTSHHPVCEALKDKKYLLT